MIDSKPLETTTIRSPAASAARTNSAKPARISVRSTVSETIVSWSPLIGANSAAITSRSVIVRCWRSLSAAAHSSGA